MFDFKKIKRKLIGGIWIKNKSESSYRYCVNTLSDCTDWITSQTPKTDSFSSMGRTNTGIEVLEDYGKVTLFGKYFGYSNESPEINKRGLFFNLEEFFESDFFIGLIFGFTVILLNFLILG